MNFLLIILLVWSSNNPTEIARINSFKKEAEKSFLDGNFKDAISRYHYLMDTMGVEEDEILLNLGHAYSQSGDTTSAKTYYTRATLSKQRDIKSIAYQQLGVMAKKPQSMEESLQYLKASIKSNPANTDARYDYELVKKLLEQQKQNQQQDQDQQNQDENEEDQEQENEDQQNQEQNQDQQNQDDQNQEQNQQDQQEQDQQSQEEQDQEQQNQEQQEQQSDEEQDQSQEQSTREKLEEMNISEEKAQMILEAMRNAEVQYLQQQKRKATERPKSDKPDW